MLQFNSSILLEALQKIHPKSSVNCPLCGGNIIFSIDQVNSQFIKASAECLECNASKLQINVEQMYRIAPEKSIDTSKLYTRLELKLMEKNFSLLN